MNISSSISQVIYQTQLPGKILLKKAYMWPEYSAGNMEKIQSVSERAETLSYIKRSTYNPDLDISHSDNSNQIEYTLKGHARQSNYTITPGLFFEAFA